MISRKSVVRILVVGCICVCLLRFMIAYLPTHMSEKHTNKIVNLYFQETSYIEDDFNKRWEEKIETFELQSKLGHTIPVYYICPNNNYKNKTIVLVHWHESNHIAMEPLAEVFLKRGWNVVLYDQRAHGKNTADTVTFGYLESNDLAQVIGLVKEKSDCAIVGVLGQSMGAATAAYYLGTQHATQNLSFAVVDSAYSSMYDEIAWEISKGKVPLLANTLTFMGDRFCKLVYGYSFSDVNIIAQIHNSHTPTLMFHSKEDQTCPYVMAENMYESIPHTNKKMVTYQGSKHLFCFWDNKSQYIEELFLFIDKYINDTI